MTRSPQASRPHMPGYGLAPGDAGGGLLPWSWAVDRLDQSHLFWLSTVRSDARPHAMPVWAVWHRDELVFSTAHTSRKARNLSSNPACVIATQGPVEVVIVEGNARRVTDSSYLASAAAAYRRKYDMGYPEDSAVFAVRPAVAFGFIERDDEFQSRSTRWTFGS